MKVTVEPGTISGTITAPPSKSLTQRALAAALLHNGTTVIRNAGRSADEMAALQVIRQLGAIVQETRQDNGLLQLTVTSLGKITNPQTVDCGESGLAARLFLPITAMCNEAVTVTGSGTLLQRPMRGIVAGLRSLGVSVTSRGEMLPFTVHGPIKPTNIHVDSGGSSQFISGLLFALTATATAPVTIKVNRPESTPYLDLTMDVLAQFGKPVRHNRYREFFIDPLKFTRADVVTFDVEADWSGASCLLVAGAIAGSITIPNLSAGSLQADRRLLEVFETAGVPVDSSENGITVRKCKPLSFDFDATHCPDLFPALAALAAVCDGESNIKGVHRLFNKESNRVESITEMLWRFGVHFSCEDDILTIEGQNSMERAYIDGYKDHRIVMAAAVCALKAKGTVTITHAEAVNKSYPDFFSDMGRCGMKWNYL